MALPNDIEMADPYYLEPPTGAGTFIVNEIIRLIGSSFKYAMVRGDNYMEAQGPESGVAKAYDYHDSNQNIAQKSKNMESGENQIHELLEPFHGEVEADWPMEFDIKSLNEEMQEAIELFKADIGSPSYHRYRAQKLVEKDLEGADPEILKQIFAELDNVDPAISVEEKLQMFDKGLIEPLMQTMSGFKFDMTDEVRARIADAKQVTNPKEEKPAVPTLKELME